MRSPTKQLGSYRTLGELEKLVSVSCENAFDLKGRYEQTGKSLFNMVTELTTIEDAVEVRICSLHRYVFNFNFAQGRKKVSKRVSDYDRATPILKAMHNRLALNCDGIISFMLSVPFDLRAFDLVMREMSR